MLATKLTIADASITHYVNMHVILSSLQALQKQLAEIEPVFETVVSEGASLTRLVPGEGAEHISQVLNKTQRQFAQISDQILKKVEKQKASTEMKAEVSHQFSVESRPMYV